MLHLKTSAAAIALAAGMLASPALSAPVQLSDAQLGAVAAGIRFTITNQVADRSGVAPVTDPLLVNPWGLSQGPGGPLWVANNHTDSSTVYNKDTFGKLALEVAVPGGPTGTTYVGLTNAFNITSAGKTGQTVFAFATESGQIQGWNPTVDPTHTVVAVDQSASGSIFKGLTLGLDETSARLFAADFGNGVVSVYDTSFNKIRSFTDPKLPDGYVPFNVQNLSGLLYVAFAKKEPGAADETVGRGLGFVDVFDTDGHLLRRLIEHGRLNAPWGLAIAPANFGKFAGALLVGNFGDGRIDAYDRTTGAFIGALRDEDRRKVSIEGLWALRTGPNGTITFSAGPAEETQGLLGSIGPQVRTWGHDEMASMVMKGPH
ncbi:TIGR03118 family protein [Phenylobacterium hankyongense]|uniref:TIGR03118 family protein n=1 Tax=Phenylobacterium hankyongense TaxID=1813876 RepID=A0A328AYK5_9CAUL|nr:TIGR03118 family protein [Phenylobacterium hankyongense]RAK60190.1 TIGR03118 family protein [Phenylobacterium hankyongense]